MKLIVSRIIGSKKILFVIIDFNEFLLIIYAIVLVVFNEKKISIIVEFIFYLYYICYHIGSIV